MPSDTAIKWRQWQNNELVIMEEPQTIWDKRYSQHNKAKSKYNNWVEPWHPLFAPGSVILDLGCGRGYDTQYLLSTGCRVISTDFSREALKLVKQNVKQAIPVQVDMRQGLPFSPQKFHIVIANPSLHYFPLEQTRRIIHQIRECLTENRILLARFNSTDDVNYGARAQSENGENYFLVNGVMKHFFDRETLEQLFETGWKVESLQAKVIHRFGKPKSIWEIAAEKASSQGVR